jgi:hypothetical protein
MHITCKGWGEKSTKWLHHDLPLRKLDLKRKKLKFVYWCQQGYDTTTETDPAESSYDERMN